MIERVRERNNYKKWDHVYFKDKYSPLCPHCQLIGHSY